MRPSLDSAPSLDHGAFRDNNDAIANEVQSSLDGLDTQLLDADPRLADIAKTISHAAKMAVGQSEGEAKLRMLPMNTWDLISRAAVVLKNISDNRLFSTTALRSLPDPYSMHLR